METASFSCAEEYGIYLLIKPRLYSADYVQYSCQCHYADGEMSEERRLVLVSRSGQ